MNGVVGIRPGNRRIKQEYQTQIIIIFNLNDQCEICVRTAKRVRVRVLFYFFVAALCLVQNPRAKRGDSNTQKTKYKFMFYSKS